MRRITAAFIIMITALWVISPANAQVSQWLAWLYDSDSGQMTLLDNSGMVQENFTLPMPEGFSDYPAQVVVSHGGQYVAYVTTGADDLSQIYVYAPDENTVKVVFDLPPILADSISLTGFPGHFNEVDTMVAVGYALENDEWEVSAIDIEAGGRIHLLRNNGPTTPQPEPGDPTGLVPIIHRFLINEVTYMLIPVEAESEAPYTSFAWNAPAGNIVPDPAFVNLDYDLLAATDEIVLTDPARTGSLRVFDPGLRESWSFYRDDSLHVFAPRFVQNGERILVGAEDANGEVRYNLLERDGTPVGILQASGAAVTSVYGLTDGYIYTLVDEAPSGVSRLLHVNTRTGARNLLWTSEAGSDSQLVWVSDRRIVPIGPFIPWARLADVVSER